MNAHAVHEVGKPGALRQLIEPNRSQKRCDATRNQSGQEPAYDKYENEADNLRDSGHENGWLTDAIMASPQF